MRTDCFNTHAIERLMGMEYLRVKTFQTDSTTFVYEIKMCEVLYCGTVQTLRQSVSGDR